MLCPVLKLQLRPSRPSHYHTSYLILFLFYSSFSSQPILLNALSRVEAVAQAIEAQPLWALSQETSEFKVGLPLSVHTCCAQADSALFQKHISWHKHEIRPAILRTCADKRTLVQHTGGGGQL